MFTSHVQKVLQLTSICRDGSPSSVGLIHCKTDMSVPFSSWFDEFIYLMLYCSVHPLNQARLRSLITDLNGNGVCHSSHGQGGVTGNFRENLRSGPPVTPVTPFLNQDYSGLGEGHGHASSLGTY
jgi:hypothetical protein